MPRESLRSLLMSAENEAVKRFLSHMHQTWNQLQVSYDEQAMEMMTSALLHKFPRVTPDLFVDLSQFIPFMSVSDIMSFPSLLLVNDSVGYYANHLTAIRDHSSEMKPLQKRAFVKRLLQSNVLGQVPLWPPYFLRSLQPLLPYLPLCHFQQLTAEQVCDLNNSNTASQWLLSCGCMNRVKMYLFCTFLLRLGILLCYMNPENLQALLRFQPFLKRLLWCVSQGLISPTSRVNQEISGMLLDLLGPLFPFLDSSRVEQVQREALLLRLDEFKGYCLPPEALLELGQLLKEAAVLGYEVVRSCQYNTDVILDSFVTFMTHDEASGLDTVEQILESQRDWETSKVGQNCGPIEKMTEKKKSLTARFVTGTAVYIFLFFSPEPIPSCSDLKGTFPAAWTAGQFLGMLEQELLDCLDVLGQDPELSAEQRKALWDRLKQMYVPLRSVKPEQILQLGWIVTQLSDKELQELDLSHLEIVAYMGQFDQWTPKQVRIHLSATLRSGQSIENLEMSKLVSFGFFICGLSPTEISRLDPKSALFLGELNLGCSELQAEALTTRIMLSDAFGPVSEWGPEIFMEIGTLAAGLPDVVLSSLIREQFEGLTPAAIGLMPASKFAVVFSPVHLSWMTPEQARAVTPHQWIELNSEQSQAVSMAQYEGELIQEQRGRGAVVPDGQTGPNS
uniref:Stereocilin n=1 Tax=Erpetoichthys calabaricus TaxID=27687 RepID=A0A8C4TI39_ERPCA